MKVALVGTSLKENEHRMPVHPMHLSDIDPALRSRLTLDSGYGAVFGLDDRQLVALGFAIEGRSSLIATCDVAILPKPVEADLQALKPGALLWGWLHFVLYGHLADICIARRHTVVTFEAMFDSPGSKRPAAARARHVFAGNNRLAGYAGTLHALGISGLDGRYGPPRPVAVIGFGSAGQAAVEALEARGFDDITVYTRRDPERVDARPPGVRFRRIRRDHRFGCRVDLEAPERDSPPLVDVLKAASIIVNCGEQDPENPLMYVLEQDLAAFDHECLIIDISCDPAMGFCFARTTSFDHPTYRVGRATVYAVDHSPGHLWDAATFQISREVLRYLPQIAAGPEAALADPVLAAAAEIVDGTVRNAKVLRYQGRAPTYPHAAAARLLA